MRAVVMTAAGKVIGKTVLTMELGVTACSCCPGSGVPSSVPSAARLTW